MPSTDIGRSRPHCVGEAECTLSKSSSGLAVSRGRLHAQKPGYPRSMSSMGRNTRKKDVACAKTTQYPS
eukprot:12653241-Prorocentrum_lima.AAC.1